MAQFAKLGFNPAKRGDKFLFNMLQRLITDISVQVNEFINRLVINLLDAVFWPEHTMGVGTMGAINISMGQISFNPLFDLFRNIGLAFITLKFLKKGFDIYIGWVDGDKDTDTGHLVLNYVRAIITVLAFHEIYQFIVNIITSLLSEALSALTAGATPDFNTNGIILEWNAFAFIDTIIILILLIILIIIYFRLLIMGLQLLMLRIAFPVACVGLVDSDKGIFKNFLQKFIMLSVSAFAQIFFFRFSLLLTMNANPFWGLAAAMAATKTPDILRDFMLGYGGTGAGGKAISLVQQAIMVKNSIGSVASRMPLK